MKVQYKQESDEISSSYQFFTPTVVLRITVRSSRCPLQCVQRQSAVQVALNWESATRFYFHFSLQLTLLDKSYFWVLVLPTLIWSYLLYQWFSSWGPAASAVPGNLLGMLLPRPGPVLTESETLGVGFSPVF